MMASRWLRTQTRASAVAITDEMMRFRTTPTPATSSSSRKLAGQATAKPTLNARSRRLPMPVMSAV
jgi:hypothetical protein